MEDNKGHMGAVGNSAFKGGFQEFEHFCKQILRLKPTRELHSINLFLCGCVKLIHAKCKCQFNVNVKSKAN